MSLWRQLSHGLRGLGPDRDRDLTDEVQHYFDQAVADWTRRGLSGEDARRAAQLEVGNLTGVREHVRSDGWENIVETFLTDLRYAGRRLRGDVGFTAVAVVTLALGIGASTAIFSAVKPVLIDALPYPDAERVVALSDFGADGEPIPVTFGTYRELVARSHSFDALAVMKPWQPTILGDADAVAERLDGQAVAWQYFRALGVRPAIGRDFAEAEDLPGAPNVVILSDGVWRRRFGADRKIIGQQIRLDAAPYTVIGVMPRGFENVLAPTASAWRTLAYDPALPAGGREWGHHLSMVGRLRRDVTVANASREVETLGRNPVSEFVRARWANLQNGLRVTSLQNDVSAGVRPALLAVMGAVLLLLAIACVNVTNLLLARGAQRRGELAMRVALGASSQRITRQLLTESVVLALIGAALGLLVAMLGIRAVVALSPAALPRVGAIRLDSGVLAFAVVTAAVVGILVGLVPAAQATRVRLAAAGQETSRRTSDGHQRARGALVVAEVALALVLLIGAGLLLRSLERLFAIRPGFDPAGLLTLQVQLNGPKARNDTLNHQYFADAVAAVRALPGVESVGLVSQLPLSGDLDKYGPAFQTVPAPTNVNEDWSVSRYAITPDYLRTMRIPLVRGRVLEERDMQPTSPRPVLVSETLARKRFGRRDPIGERMRMAGATDRPWDVIVGVVGDVKHTSLAETQSDAVYAASPQWIWADNPMWFVVRAKPGVPPASLAPTVQRAIRSVDREQPIARVGTMEALIDATAAERRFALVLFEAFAVVALVLAAIGIYGVLSGRVTERLREIGVRAALGASPGEIVRLIIRQGLSLTAVGVVLGLVGAMFATRALVSLLFGVSTIDAVTYAGVVAMLLAVSALACSLPAWRAARVDPAITLRSD